MPDFFTWIGIKLKIMISKKLLMLNVNIGMILKMILKKIELTFIEKIAIIFMHTIHIEIEGGYFYEWKKY